MDPSINPNAPTQPPGPAETSAMALQGLGLKRRETLGHKVYAVVAQAVAEGSANLSAREVQALFEQHHHIRLEMSTLSGVINNLVQAERLQRILEPRACTVTGRQIQPIKPVPKQGRLVA